MPTRQLALLRGINVGKHKQLPMAELRELLEALGYEDVATHLRSGNAVYTTAATPAKAVGDIEAAIAERFGFDVSVVVRTAAQVDKILARDPFGDIATDAAKYLVVFFSERPSAAMRKRLDGLELGNERLRVDGSEAYVWAPSGINESKAWKALSGSGVGAVATARNWNTVRKLAELLG